MWTLKLQQIKVILVWTASAVMLAKGQDLRPGGANVCSRTESYNSYEQRQFTRIGYDNYRTCCKRVLRACVSRCTRYRTKIETYYNNVLVIRYQEVYFCCTGWARSGDHCPLPICNPGCVNGDCVQPNICQCRPGFTGKLCEQDVDECALQPPRCQQNCQNLPGTYACSCRVGYQKTNPAPVDPGCTDVNECSTNPCTCADGNPGCVPGCHNTDGSFYCSCAAGFQLTNGRVCTDVNECASSSTNQCEHTCLNRPGSYGCACNSGYHLLPDGKRCQDVDECATLNGGCSQICRNQAGSFYCECLRGYRLTDNRLTCADVDECSESKPCDQKEGICSNVLGSYICSCKVGFALMPDKHTCTDVDECKDQASNSCHQNCHNTYGTYTCSCNVGYRLDADQRKCNDIDECAEGAHKCSQNCHNNVGSYSCSCRAGYKLEADGLTCTGLPCETIAAPINGRMACSGFVTDQSCSFQCDDGFNLAGSDKRTCLPSSTWSGLDAVCKAKPCPELSPPTSGSVVIPCVEFFGSTCLVKCSPGFYLVGSSSSQCVVDDKKETTWQPNNGTCLENKPCFPNPCRHSGSCFELSNNKFRCDCSSTMYQGDTCQRGLISIPPLPELTVDEESEELVVKARPDDVLEIVPEIVPADAAVISPDKWFMKYPRSEVAFKITAKKSGPFKLDFKLRGSNAPSFDKPDEVTIYAVAKRPPVPPVDVSASLFKDACHTRPMRKCRNGASVNLISTCAWNPSTTGFVAAQGTLAKIPLSPVGLTEKTLEGYVINPSQEIEEILKTRLLAASCQQGAPCPGIQLTSDTVNFVIDYHYFQRLFLQSVNALVPPWVSIEPDMTQQLFGPDNIKAVLGEGRSMRTVEGCGSLSFTDDDLFIVYTPKMPIFYRLLSFKTLSSTSNVPGCFAVNLCTDSVQIALPAGQSLDLSASFNSMGISATILATELSFPSATSNCFKFSGESSCTLHPTMTLKLNGKYSSAQNKISVSLKGMLALESFERKTALLTKLSTTTKVAFEGSVDYQITIKMLGENLVIQDTSNRSTAQAKLGDRTPSCPACEDSRGIKMAVSATASSFHYSSSVLKFYPKSDAVIRHLYDAFGGSVLGVENLNKLKLQARGLNFIQADFQSLLGLLAGKYVEDSKLISMRGNTLIKKIGEFQTAAETSDVAFEKITAALYAMGDDAYDFKSSLWSLRNRLGTDAESAKIASSSANLLRRLDALSLLDPIPTVGPVVQKDNGIQFSYSGALCVHKLCLDNVDVTISDLLDTTGDKDCTLCSDSLSGLKDSVRITAKSSKDHYLSERLVLPAGEMLVLDLKRDSHEFVGKMPVTLKLFGGNYKTHLHFDANEVKFAMQGVRIGSDMSVNVESSVSITDATWPSVIYRIQGQSLDHLAALASSAQLYFESTATDTIKRKSRSSQRVNETTNDLRKAEDAELLMKANLDKAYEAWREKNARHKWLLKSLSGNQTEMDSYLPDLGPRFIEQNVDTVCKLETCTESCVSMPECKICQDAVSKDVDTLKCDQFTQNIKTSGLAPYKSDCDVTRYQFIPIYTGSCAISSGEQAAQQANFQKSLVATGSGVGALVGSVIPGVGTVIGAAVGAVVGFVSSLFSSCDKSYEVLTRKWVEQEPCTLLRMEVTTVTRAVSECYYVRTTVLTGYDTPKECECKTNPCIAKVSDSSCVLKNINCQKDRSVFLASSTAVPAKFTDLYTRLESLKEQTQVASLEESRFRSEKEFYEREYNRAVNVAAITRQEASFAMDASKASDSVLAIGSCLANIYAKTKVVSDLLAIQNIRFQVKLPIIDNIQFNAEVYHKETHAKKHVSFVYDINDSDISLKGASKKIVHEMLCESARKRRALQVIDVDRDLQLPFTSWFIDDSENATTVQKSCLTLHGITSLLNYTIKELINLTQAALEVQRVSQASQKIVYADFALASTSGLSATHALLGAQTDLLNTVRNSIEQVQKRTDAAEVLHQWKQNAEIYTSANNYTICLTFDDCLEVAHKSLLNLPTILSAPRAEYERMINETISSFRALSETPLHTLLPLAKKVQSQVDQINGIALHCADRPKIRSSLSRRMDVPVGETVRLRCLADSKLPVKYYWMRHNETLDTESNNEITFVAGLESTGVYACVAWSLTGQDTSSGMEVHVHQVPQFIEQPQSVSHYLPSSEQVKPTFVCNVTAFPAAAIQWWFADFSGLTKKIDAAAKAVYAIPKPSEADAGFYWCNASNAFGYVVSRKARLDVLKLSLAAQSLQVSFSTDAKAGVSQASFTKLLTEIGGDASQGVSFEYKENQGGQTASVLVTVDAKPSASGITTPEGFLEVASQVRQRVANTAANLVSHILLKKSTLTLDDESTLKVDNDTLAFQFRFNICQPGYDMHHSGFMCSECPVGSAGEGCRKCPLNSFQSLPGQATCTPCTGGRITERTGSMKIEDCVEIKNASTDILFLIDAAPVTLPSKDWVEYLKSVYDEYKATPNTRFAIIGFNNRIAPYMPFSYYKGRESFVSAVSVLYADRGTKNIHDALLEAEKMFDSESSETWKRILVLVTSPRLTAFDDLDQTRKYAWRLQASGTIILGISLGRYFVDPKELTVVASQPKTSTVLFPLKVDDLAQATTRLLNDVVVGAGPICTSTEADFALVYESISYFGSTNRIKADTEKIKSLVSRLYAASPSDHKMAFMPESLSKYGDGVIFHAYDTSKMLNDVTDAWLQSLAATGDRQDSLETIVSYVVNERISETYQALARLKFLVVVSQVPIADEFVQRIQRKYEEPLTIANFAFEYADGVLPAQTMLTPKTTLLRYGFYQIDKFLTKIAQMKLEKHSYCRN